MNVTDLIRNLRISPNNTIQNVSILLGDDVKIQNLAPCTTKDIIHILRLQERKAPVKSLVLDYA